MSAIVCARELNATLQSGCLDRTQIGPLLIDRELIFSDTRIYVAAEHLQTMAKFIALMQEVVALPGWQEVVLANVPGTAKHATKASGVFFGYDFHIDATGPKLIEINTNAGGGLLNVQLLKAQHGDRVGLSDVADVGRDIVDMFLAEWRATGKEDKPGRVAIVDDKPKEQYLNPDFEMCRQLLESNGIATLVCDAQDLKMEGSVLTDKGQRIDLVYNRLTDFFLDLPEHQALREAWLTDAAVITPNPYNYALYADKRHLVLLSDDAWLAAIGVKASDRELIQAIVPRTEHVTSSNVESIRERRKQLFFKPATGYGSKATYRGQNVTTRVFGEIVAAGNYIAQALVPPQTRAIMVDGALTELKFDLRCYAYRGKVLLTAARLWQGQTTNFRTKGGGFTPVVEVA